ncbi:FKBP-type peptidyl-prolyl cis-trans isomerase N-terminal domain-containing protein [Sphingobacterium sp. Ag1]|uniref:FKBP-type peptidyl-prolyl cis-trans isomerase N-terminal domain-containing protein n=1 Tax=Sphingobacterium sp. Ag1 TaxID=1643451 RepID=UPI000699253F|nr:FKBP-type peptidyl-prolyl cis-trans isomerase N-terminal domain-containing protein [Sphingobacterium sp. Ag1]
MKNPILLALRCCALLSFLFSFVSYAQNDKTNAPKSSSSISQTDVYIAGSWYDRKTGQTFAAYYKNGKPVVLKQGQGPTQFSTVSLGRSIVINNNDIYVAGNILDADGHSLAAYWKNEQFQPIPIKIDQYGNKQTSYLNGIDISNGNIFMFPYQPGTLNEYYYFKNGQETNFPNEVPASVINDRVHFVSGNDVYVANATDEAAYWKNGAKVTLDNTLHVPNSVQVSSIFVSGSDVYVSGFKSYASKGADNTNKQMAVYWKNGQEIILSTGTGRYATRSTRSIFVSGNDVYVAGMSTDPNTGESMAVYWKNGQEVVLAKGPTFTQALAIAVSGSDVYVAGENSNRKVYWKNGQETNLTDCAEISSMVVSKRNGTISENRVVAKKESTNVSPSLVKENLSPKEEEANDFFEENKKRPGVITLPSGLQYEVIRQGTGPKPTLSDQVKILNSRTVMEGKDIKGVIKGQSPIIIRVADLLQGQAQGLLQMNVGSIYKLYVPAKLGHPKQTNHAIIFVMETELLEIVQ